MLMITLILFLQYEDSHTGNAAVLSVGQTLSKQYLFVIRCSEKYISGRFLSFFEAEDCVFLLSIGY